MHFTFSSKRDQGKHTRPGKYIKGACILHKELEDRPENEEMTALMRHLLMRFPRARSSIPVIKNGKRSLCHTEEDQPAQDQSISHRGHQMLLLTEGC